MEEPIFGNLQHFYLSNYIINHNIETDLYLDSRDYIRIVQGLKVINYKKKDFINSDSILVYSLAYSNWLGKCFISTPHQSELVKMLDEQEKFGSQEASRLELGEFWHFAENVLGLNETSLKKMNDENDLIEQLKKKGEELYKVNYFLIETRWKSRLRHLYSTGVLTLDNTPSTYDTYLQSPMFQAIKKEFDQTRPFMKGGNLIDAFAIMELHDKLERFKQGHTNCISLFYDDQKLFKPIIEKLGYGDKFSIELQHAKLNIFCDAEFLKILAISKNKEKIASFADDKFIHNIVTLQTKMDAHKGPIEMIAEELAENLKDIEESKFLQKCLIENEEKIADQIRQLLEGTGVKQILQQEIEEINQSLRQNVEKFNFFIESYISISKSRNALQKILEENREHYRNSEHKFDVFIDFSMLRFPFKAELTEKYNMLCNKIFIDETPDENESVQQVSSYIHETLTEKSGDMMIVLGVFWVLDQFDMIRKTVESPGYVCSYFGEMYLYAAALARLTKTDHSRILITKTEQVLDYINNLQMDFNGNQLSFERNFECDIISGYTYFQLWRNSEDNNFIDTSKEPRQKDPHNFTDSLFLKSIQFCENAISILEKHNFYQTSDQYLVRQKYYYVLNNYVYYVTAGHSNDKFAAIEEKVSKLEKLDLEFEASTHISYRFYDTLALYYYRSALISSQQNDRVKFEEDIENARQFASKALKWVLNVKEKKIFHQLSQRIDRLEKKKKQN